MGDRNGLTDRQADRQADRQTDRQTGRQAGRQTDRQTDQGEGERGRGEESKNTRMLIDYMYINSRKYVGEQL